MFRRATSLTKPASRFYVKGSYVLDVVFGRNAAADVDVFYDRSCEQPTEQDIKSWLASKQLPLPAAIDRSAVDSIDDCSGGGFPIFNIDRWHIRMDGELYTLEETSEPSGVLPLFGQTAFKMKPIRLRLEDARKQKLLEIASLDDLQRAPDELKYLRKLLKKLTTHPELDEPGVRSRLEAFAGALELELLTGLGDVDLADEAPESRSDDTTVSRDETPQSGSPKGG